MLPESLKQHLSDHLKNFKRVHDKDLADGWGHVLLPGALDRKYPRMAMAVGSSTGKPLDEHQNRRRGTAPYR